MPQVPSNSYPQTRIEHQSADFQSWCNTRSVCREIHEIEEGFRVSYIDMHTDHTKYLYLKNRKDLHDQHI